ncbi:hypothetical protein DXB46_01395 [Lachnospiraceae bacterium OM04-12BH]|nr:hypothetical protein DXB46_01395 [Lachnospiraceae bacterium OM04-12BH]
MHLFDAFSYFQFEEFSQPQDDWLWNEIKFLVVSLQEEDSLRSASQPQEDLLPEEQLLPLPFPLLLFPLP